MVAGDQRAFRYCFFICGMAFEQRVIAGISAEPLQYRLALLNRKRAAPPHDLGRCLSGRLGWSDIWQRRTAREPAQRNAQNANGYGSRSARALLQFGDRVILGRGGRFHLQPNFQILFVFFGFLGNLVAGLGNVLAGALDSIACSQNRGSAAENYDHHEGDCQFASHK